MHLVTEEVSSPDCLIKEGMVNMCTDRRGVHSDCLVEGRGTFKHVHIRDRGSFNFRSLG